MTELAEVYLARLPTRVEALTEARSALARSEELADDTVRRLAHMIRGSAGSFGFPEISERAARVEDAPSEALIEELDALLGHLEAVLDAASVRHRVLVIDDDPDLTSILSHRLSHPTSEVRVASSGTTALTAIETEVPDVIILDLMLPDMDGRDLLARVRESAGTAMVPVLVLTVRGGRALRLECMALGANEYFEKPVDVDLLSERVTDELQRALLARREGRRDGLTGLANRAALAEAFEQCQARSRRTGTAMSLGILDLDHFKAVNDSEGHGAGDEALRRFGELLKTTLRTTDVGARWGGDEFVVLFEGAQPEEAVTALDKVRAAAEQLETGLLRRFGFSAGIAAVGDSLDATIGRADLALYQAKRAGRGRTLTEGSNSDAQPVRVVLAEDDDQLAELVVRVLGERGFHTRRFSDGALALQAIEGDPPELVLLDVEMPGMNGFDVLRAIRRLYTARQTRIVMITTTRTESALERAFELGADDYLVKPFAPRELIARLRRLVHRGPPDQ